MENKIYTCPYCNKEHETPGGLARCILVCEDKIKMEEEAKQRAKLAAEKEARYLEVVHAYENFEELRNQYVIDYGSFTFKARRGDDSLSEWVFRSAGLF